MHLNVIPLFYYFYWSFCFGIKKQIKNGGKLPPYTKIKEDLNEMSEKEILEKINSILESAKIIAENNVDMDDFEMEIDVPDKV